MWKAGLQALVLAGPLAALAQPQVEILSPVPNECFANGGGVFEGGIIGGEVQPPARDLRGNVRIGDAQGRELSVTVEAYTPVAEGVPPATADCDVDADCVAGPGGQCFPIGECGCFADADCADDQPCVGNRCGCQADADCGANGRCLADGRCGCANNGYCGQGQACGLDGLCQCAADDHCRDGQACIDGTCHTKGDLQSYDTFFDAPDDGALVETDEFGFGGDAVRDAPVKVFAITARAGGDVTSDRVSFQLDRSVPLIQFQQAFLDSLGGCRAVPPDLQGNLPGVIVDNQDPNPSLVSVETTTDGCAVSQTVQVTDACGNAQNVLVETFTRPPAGAVSVTLNGYRCGLEGCVIDEEARFADGSNVAKASLFYDIDAPRGCFSGVDATVRTGMEASEILIPGETIQTEPARLVGPVGPYDLEDGMTLEIQLNDDEPQVITFRAADVRNIDAVTTAEAIRIINAGLDGAIAKVDLGLVLETQRRGLGQSVSIAGGLAAPLIGFFPDQTARGSGDGPTAARVDVYACGDEQPLVSASLNFTIIDRPVADAGGPYSGTQGDIIQLSAENSFADPIDQGGIVEYAWDLDGDGRFDVIGDAAEARTVGFDSGESGDGEFRVLLRITAGNGTVEFDNATVVVDDVDPECDLGNGGLPYAGVEGELVTFDASASAPGHPSDPIIAYDWDFGDGLFPQRGDDLTMPAHTFEEARGFTVTLRVEDIDSSTECQIQVNIDDVEPTIRNAGAFDAEELVEGSPVRFFVEAVPGSPSDAINDIGWNFGDGSQPINGLDRNPRHTYTDDTEHRQGGPYQVCVQVADEDDQVQECFNVVIRDLQPEVSFVGQAVGNEGDIFTFDATNTIAGGPADPLRRLTFDFGDGSAPLVINNVNDPNARRVQHRFERSSITAQNPNGSFMVTLTAEDEDSSTQGMFEVRVRDVQPFARVRVVYEDPEQVGYEGVPLEFDASDSEPGSDTDPIARYIWDFGDGSDPVETVEPLASHAFPDQGLYNVTLFVEDSDGSRVSVDVATTIRNVGPTNARILGENQVEIGQEARLTVAYDDVEGDAVPNRTIWYVDGEEVSQDLVFTYAFPAIDTYEVSVDVFDDGDESTSATFQIEVTPAAPRISNIGRIVGREGEEITFDIEILPAPLDNEGNLDAPVRVLVGPVPNGAEHEIIEEDRDGVPVQIVRARWTPTYYDAGEHVFRVRAEGRINETSRTRDVNIQVDEAGTPLLATAGGTGRRGQVTLYEYGLEAGVVSFSARARVDVGIGAGGLTYNANGQRVFVATSGRGVAVVGTREGALLRTVPTGPGTNAVAYGDDYVWATNAQANTLTAIDAQTLKIEATVSLAPMDRPADIHWIPAGVAGLAAPRLLVVGAGTGDMALIDPDEVLDGNPGIVQRGVIGGVLSRATVDGATGTVYASDGKTRRVYAIDLADFIRSPNGIDPDAIEFTFAPFDLLAGDGVLWAATEAGLVRVEGGEQTTSAAIQARGLAPLPAGIVTGGELVISTVERVENLDGDLNRIIDSAGGRIRRLAAFVAFE